MKVVKEDDLGEIVEALKKGKAVVFPTDTVYGLLVDATNETAVQRVFEIKGREEGKSLPVFVKDIQMAKEYAEISNEQETYMQEVWPGKFTVVLKSKHTLPAELEMEGKVALRIPDYELVDLLLEKVNRPLTGTSANVSGLPSCSSAEEVMKQFNNREAQPDFVLNAGTLAKSKPSTVVDITEQKQKIIRK